MNELSNTERNLNVFNTETNKWIEVPPELQRTAGYMHQQIIAGSLITAMAIKKIKDDELYLGLGCQNFEEYITTMLPFGRRAAYNYLKVANKLDIIFPQQLENKRLSENASNNLLSDVHLGAQKTEGLNYQKLLELTSLKDDDFKTLLKDGEVEINGTNLNLEDIKEMTARQAAIEIKKIKDKYRTKVDVLSEENKKLIQEKKELKEQIEKNEDIIDAAYEKEKLYGKAAVSYEAKTELLLKAEKTLNEFVRLVMQAGITTEDSSVLQEKLVWLIRKTDEVHATLADNHGQITINFMNVT